MPKQNNELEIENEYDDDIFIALYDAISDNDGLASAKYLRYHLAKHGLHIVPKDPL